MIIDGLSTVFLAINIKVNMLAEPIQGIDKKKTNVDHIEAHRLLLGYQANTKYGNTLTICDYNNFDNSCTMIQSAQNTISQVL